MPPAGHFTSLRRNSNIRNIFLLARIHLPSDADGPDELRVPNAHQPGSFSMTIDTAGMIWSPDKMDQDNYFLELRIGGLRGAGDKPVSSAAPGHYRLDIQIKRRPVLKYRPAAMYVSDRGRTQITTGSSLFLPE